MSETPPPAPTVSVLIATCNRPRLLPQSIAAVLASDRLPEEIFVMDQSDGDESRRALDALDPGAVHIHYHHLDERGKSGALNRALALATGDYVALTDDDVTVSRGWIATFLELHRRDPGVDAFCGRVLPEEGTDPRDYLNLVTSEVPRRLGPQTNPVQPSFCGANLVVRRTALIGAGGYNLHLGPGGRFKSNDDGELAYRLTRAGLDVRYAPELVVRHLGWRHERENAALLHDYAFSLGGFAGYRARRRDVVPLPYFAKVVLEKVAQVTLGAVLFDRRRVGDGWAHLSGYGQGFVAGLATGPGAGRSAPG